MEYLKIFKCKYVCLKMIDFFFIRVFVIKLSYFVEKFSGLLVYFFVIKFLVYDLLVISVGVRLFIGKFFLWYFDCFRFYVGFF